MRLSSETRFPHPVLGPETGDFTAGEFDVDFTLVEHRQTGALTFGHRITLTEPDIRQLVETGRAEAGCFVRCADTFFAELRRMSWPEGSSDFAAGRLLNRVSLRPIVWLVEDLSGWDPGTINPEFDPPVALDRGEIIALSAEHVISVGQAKLAPMESIFQLDRSPDVPEGTLQVDPDRDRITILAAPGTYETIRVLREQRSGRNVVMNAVYLPAVMEVLDALRLSDDAFQDRRWYQTFHAKCDAKGIDLSADLSILESAQKLLDGPAGMLAALVAETE
ncbi:MAG: hypothetical protein OXQ89_09950 [Rhodospirillaceae bacterium]|nr:hypothetical protein [Rhodospirillaceae bacterium]MDD9998053.1 hypothetical protein [Rhodospirillaceae bacterium]MDE0359840.1 hypothetical protein [Rhodospirillaceae bacterium]